MKKLLCLAALAAGLSTSANATVAFGVRITSQDDTYLQIREFQAFEKGTGLNVALADNGGVATAANQLDNDAGAVQAIDGSTSTLMYHSADPIAGDEYWQVDSAQAYDLDRLTIFGRGPGCCGGRDLYTYTLLDAFGGSIATGELDARDDPYEATVFIDQSTVPEPAAWGLMIAGFGLVGASLRRRRAGVAVAA